MITKTLVAKYLENAGVAINGNNPYDPQIYNDQIYKRLRFHPTLSAGESYMEGWWDCEQLDEFFYRVCKHAVDADFKGSLSVWAQNILNSLLNLQTKDRSVRVAEEHS